MRTLLRSRKRLLLLGLGVVAAFAVGCATDESYGPYPYGPPPPSYQPHMQNALNSLQIAQSELQLATPNKGGHRERALNLVSHAIYEVQMGIQWAAEHGN